LDIGRQEDGLALSNPGFFRVGVTNEFLKLAGKWPVDNERLNKCVRNGVSMSET